jgi:hypothetical protein
MRPTASGVKGEDLDNRYCTTMVAVVVACTDSQLAVTVIW